MEQGTPEWFAARLGKVTASRVSDVMDIQIQRISLAIKLGRCKE